MQIVQMYFNFRVAATVRAWIFHNRRGYMALMFLNNLFFAELIGLHAVRTLSSCQSSRYLIACPCKGAKLQYFARHLLPKQI
jgi:hypothetical protein